MDFSKTIIKDITNSNFEHNTFINANGDVTVINNNSDFNDKLYFSNDFDEVKIANPIIAGSGEKRTEILIDKTEKLMFYSKNQINKPTIRTYGYFSAFSSIRQPSESSDIAKLELIEKSNLLKMATQGYHIKAIIALDIGIICNLGYSPEQCVERCKDLYSNILAFDNYSNVEIVFDTGVTLNSLWILDSLLKAESLKLNIDPNVLNYNSTMFDSNLNSIKYSVIAFDELFLELKRKSAWRFEKRLNQKRLSQSDYVKKEINDRLRISFKGDRYI